MYFKTNKIMTQEEIKERIDEFIEHEGRSCSMDIAGITPEYVYRMWGGKVPQKDIVAAMTSMQ